MPAQQSNFRHRMLALANGGFVQGPGSSTSDSIPARLSDGEFVLPADTVRKVGARSLRDLVAATHAPSGNPPRRGRFADGGLVDDDPNKPSVLSSPRNTFPGNRMAGDSGFSGAPVRSLPPAPAVQQGGLQGVADRVAQIPTDGYHSAPMADGSQDSWRNTETGRNLSNIGSALPGSVGNMVPTVAKTGGAISAGINRAAGALSGTSAGLGMVGLGSMPAAAQPSQAGASGAGRGSVNPPAADPSAPVPSAVAAPVPQSGYGPIGERSTLSNEQAAVMNPGGRITVTRGANGTTEFSGANVSGQVSYSDPSGKALPGGGLNGKGFSNFDVAPAGGNVGMGENVSYAFSSLGAQEPVRSLAAVAGVAPTGAAGQAGSLGQRSPVGISVEQAQREGLVGARVGYAPQFDQRLTAGQGSDARARLLAAGSDAQPAQVPWVQAPTVRHSGNDWAARNALRSAEVSASSITNQNVGRNRTTPAQDAYRTALANDTALQQAEPAMAQAAMRENAGLHRVGLQQEGETLRSNIRAQSDTARTQIELGKLALNQTAAGFQNRTAQRVEDAQVALANAKTPEELRSARQRLMGLMGKSDEDRNLSHNFMARKVPVLDEKGRPTGAEQQEIVDLRTGRAMGQGPGSTPLPASQKEMVKGQVYQTARGPARWDGGQFQLVP
jgi:hypothetical protein